MSNLFPTLSLADASGAGAGLPLSDVDVEVAIDALGFTALVTQVFGNDHEVPIEVVYTFPLPGGIAVNGCTIRIGDRVLDATLKELGAARMEYDEAVRQGLTASIVEKNLSEVFTVRVGNVAPNSEIEVQLTLHGEVAIDEGEATLRFPTVVAPRYSSLDAAPESDDTRLIPRVDGGSSSVRTRFTIDVADGTLGEGGVIRCTSHHELGTMIGHRIDDIALDRDVVWRWPVPESCTTGRWVPDADDPETGIVEVVIREQAPSTHRRLPVDVTVLVDRSGSMGGSGQVIGNGIAGDILVSLGTDDTVDVIQFGSFAGPLPACESGRVRPGTSAFRSLVDEVSQIRSQGGTELIGAIRLAAQRLPAASADRDRVLVLITDGQFGNESEAVRLRTTLLKDVRIVVIGVNLAVSGGFLAELARGSYLELVNDDRRRVEVSRRVCARITSPLYGGVQIEGVSEPTRPEGVDVYAGALVRIAGRIDRPGDSITLVAADGTRRTVPVLVSGDGSVRTRWAAARLVVLEHGLSDRQDIVDLSIRHRVQCKHTAWVVVDRDGPQHDVAPITIVQPIEVAAGDGSRMLMSRSVDAACLSVDALSAPPDHLVLGRVPGGRPPLPRPAWDVISSSFGVEWLLEACRRALSDLRDSSVVTPGLVDLVERIRPLVSVNLRRSLQRAGLAGLVGPVQQRTSRRIERLLERVVVELEQSVPASTVW